MVRLIGSSAIALVLATPALAGDEVRYAPAPDWVEVAQIDAGSIEDGPSEVLYDWQHRLEDGVVRSYFDRAVRIDNPEMLTSEGTVQVEWLPDKGDITVHRFSIIRDGKEIDLAGQGVAFDVLRRERNLESRLLDGALTAAVSVPDLRQGDMLRFAYSTTLADQALGDEMQVVQYLPAKPWRVAQGRAIVSWPTGSGVSYRAGPDIAIGSPTRANGYNRVSVSLPIDKRDEMPYDAPSRFNRFPLLQVGTFDSYDELSRVMAPHYAEAAQLPESGAVAAIVARIMADTSDPLERTAMATRIVQDQVSYLMDGLNGGNYLPQDAEDTWAKRYGDCKAKSVLLNAMLQKMGIDSQVVLVTTQGGDALPEMLPLPANFDHMIVRARIDGENYWLDGTSTATRLNNLSQVPPFFYALPVVAAGSDLVAMDKRLPSLADAMMTATYDQSAGADLPIMFELEMQLTGASGARLQSVVDENDPEMKKAIAQSFGAGQVSGGQVTDVDLSYDATTAIGTVRVVGVGDSRFGYENGRFQATLANGGGQVFRPNRVRPAWREIPVMTYGPQRSDSVMRIKLPAGGEGFRLEGDTTLEETYANTTIARSAKIEGDTVVMKESVSNLLGEVEPDEIGDERRRALKVSKSRIVLRAPDDTVWRWDLEPAELTRRTQEARAAYDLAVANADEDDFGPLQARANFFAHTFAYDLAAQDISRIIAEEPSADLLLTRATLLNSLGRHDDAIADIALAYELDGAASTATWQATMLAQTGRTDEALELLDLLPVDEDDMDNYAEARSFVLGISGDTDAARAVLEERLAERENSADVLNADCWLRGTLEVDLDGAMERCTRAVERAAYPANALDSRALVRYRMGDAAGALADLDAALKLAPDLSASRYLKGIILQEQGDVAGDALVASALRQSPELKAYYNLYGIAPVG
ncbi:DUF3857 and transglutaminase domain-containing protein [Qipengyuania sp. JC766]|uniref:DUF3857 and transglutaminase domain-containing protein n=1 Tax=Qipengyuania sp. JC766 TaxID=3232139 RepID=UPI00345ACAE4